MKKAFWIYLSCWILSLALFNVIVFVTPSQFNGLSKYDTLFWISYAIITLFYIIVFLCAYLTFMAKSLKKIFYNVALIKVSITALASVFVISCICMSIIPIPEWIGIILCSIAVVANIILIAKTLLATEAISAIDNKIEVQTHYIRNLTAKAQILMSESRAESLKEILNKVYEAIRFSDPISSENLRDVENQISDAFDNFEKAVLSNEENLAKEISENLLSLLTKRNILCKASK